MGRPDSLAMARAISVRPFPLSPISNNPRGSDSSEYLPGRIAARRGV